MSTRLSSRRVATAALAAFLALGSVAVEARPGGGGSFGSRGSRTYSAPAPTATAPGMARPMERSMTQPGPSATGGLGAPAAQPRRFGLGTGFVAGLLGAGLLGAVLGNGFLGGLGGIASMFGFLLQVGLVVLLVSFAVRWFRRRQGSGMQPAMAGPAGAYARDAQPNPGSGALGGMGGGMGLGGGARPSEAPVTITPQDYQAFEQILGTVQTAYGAEDLARVRTLATPEMASYFADELAANASRGVVNRITEVKLLQGDLSEAWREGAAEYATVAMRYALKDVTTERASGRVVETGEPQAVELWTFRRERGGAWLLSAIQQTR